MNLAEIKTADGVPLSQLEPPYWYLGLADDDFDGPVFVDTVIIKRGPVGVVLSAPDNEEVEIVVAYQALEAARRGLIRRHIEAAKRIQKLLSDDIPF